MDTLQRILRLPWPLAAPSWVIPGTVAGNSRFLAGKVEHLCLMLLETEACLAYADADLPRDLAGLGLAVHTHLPLDLDWSQGADSVLDTVRRLLDKIAFLKPRLHVMHPPPYPGLLDGFLTGWTKAGLDPAALCLENTVRDDLSAHLGVLDAHGAGLCLDLGHMLRAGQDRLLAPGIRARARMIHLNAPALDGSSRHEPLTHLDEAGVKALGALLQGLNPGTVVLFEVFQWQGFMDSLRVVEQARAGMGAS